MANRGTFGILVGLFCFAMKVHAIGIDPSLEVDLIEGVYMTAMNSPEATQVSGHPHGSGPAFYFEGETRMIEVNEQTYQKLKNLLSSPMPEFTFIATVKQGRRNSGSILSITVGRSRYLEVFTSTRNGEFRFYYTHDGHIQMESIPYPFVADQWFKIAVSVSGPQLKLSVDCQENTTRQIRIPDLDFSKPGLTFYVGQRADRTYFKGTLQDVKLIATAQGYIAQCPMMGRSCPTCAQYHTMVDTITRLENRLHQMEMKFQVAEARINELETCHCQKDCFDNGQTYTDGQTWEDNCMTCTCSEGHVNCEQISCAPVYCKNPIYEDGDCCPVCRRNCTVSGVTYHHGEEYQEKLTRGAYVICIVKQCNNGGAITLQQELASNLCPVPDCPVSERFTVPGSCCEFCTGTNYCDAHDCVPPKVCVSSQTSYQCFCPTGFVEENGNCTDINECAVTEAQPEHHCYGGTVCVNMPGDYRCDCLDGYERITDTSCRQIDECATGTHNCHEDADCTDTDGSFTCTCRNRYHGDGTYCFPICNKVCQNGGVCISPSVCECPPGYEGDACELDKDECATGTHECVGMSRCVNLPGSYHCECLPGYASPTVHLDYGITCEDIDECKTANTCHRTMLCVNTEGSYECRCSAANSCSHACNTKEWGKKSNGVTWDTGTCQTCTCQSGVVSCQPRECDCSNPELDPVCCPSCLLEIQRCLHQTSAVAYENREWWRHECQDCQCQEGSIRCKAVQCIPPNCLNTYTPIGECCPRCQPHSECDLANPDPRLKTTPADCVTSSGKVYAHKQRWVLADDHCSECVCKNGNICCAYNSACAP
ncbi:protein kinase C-binding protein NELL2-like [Diadema antillarum]|uniref:protein kinase C-binding protein NELL2-like n=1 Tax=Diadema antillarum TaxID=105358 RepID=UPI003A840926